MSEMKPCPFCGSKALTNIFLDYEDIENLPTNVIDDYEPEVTCENERCIYGWWLSPKDWNTRPIEDALNARIAELEGEIAKMKKYFHKPAHGTCCTCQKCGHTYDECRCDFDEALDDLDKANARIAELEAAQRWVPVSERLPEPYTRVLACIKSGYMEVDYRFAEPIIEVGIADFYSLENVTHWMPLPEPPEVQE
jgi:hypothetical protein